MLNRIVIINSAIYAKAEIPLHDTESIQLIGKNNSGKSSLINTLNFLYIIDQKQMTFEGNRKLRDSLEHYFPHINSSYILFEIHNPAKNNHHCILIQRNKYNKLAYTYIAHPYDPTWFFKEGKQNQQLICTKKELNDKWIDDEIYFKEITDSRTLYHYIYTEKENSSPVVHLTQAASKKGSSPANHFSKIYKYLLRPTRISPNDLIEALLIAFPPAKRELTIFADRDSDSLEKMEKKGQEIKLLQEIEGRFSELKETYEAYQGYQTLLGKNYAAFLAQHARRSEELGKEKQENERKKKAHIKAQQQAQSKLQQSSQQLGRHIAHIENLKKEITQCQQVLTDIQPYKTPIARAQLEQEITELTQKRETLSKLTKRYTTHNLSERIAELTTKTQQLNRKILHFDHLLLHHISPDPKIKAQLNNLLSPELLQAPKEILKKPITHITDQMNLFDGLIDISTLSEPTPFITLEELKETLATTEKEQQLAIQLQADQATHQKITQQLKKQQALWHKIEEESTYQNALKQHLKELEKKNKQQKTTEITIAKAEEAIRTEEIQINKLTKAHFKTIETETKYNKWEGTLKSYNITPQKEIPADTQKLAELFTQLETHQKKAEELQKNAKKFYSELHLEIRSTDNTMANFIQNTDEKINTLDTLIEAHQKMLEGVCEQFALPTRNFLEDYQTFKRELQAFGTQLSNAQISDIQSLEIHLNEATELLEQLTQIRNISPQGQLDLTNNRQASLQLLRKYIADRETFTLQDLFQLQIRTTRPNSKKPIDLDPNKQMLSRGTDKMLRLFIYLPILKRLLHPKKQNRVVIYIDEIGTISTENIQKLLTRCKASHVLPIFAAPKGIEGFQHNYLLSPSPANNGKIILDQRHIISWEQGKKTSAKQWN